VNLWKLLDIVQTVMLTWNSGVVISVVWGEVNVLFLSPFHVELHLKLS
jgi:hypothetical protein